MPKIYQIYRIVREFNRITGGSVSDFEKADQELIIDFIEIDSIERQIIKSKESNAKP